MNLEKFTERSRGFIQAAQTIAMRENHQKLAPEHLLKALMDDEEGMAANLIRQAGGEPKRVVEAVDAAVAKIPRVTGDAGQVYLDNATARVLDEAEKVAKKAGGIDARRAIPPIARETYTARAARGLPMSTVPDLGVAPGSRGPLLLWTDTFTDHFDPEIAADAVAVLTGTRPLAIPMPR